MFAFIKWCTAISVVTCTLNAVITMVYPETASATNEIIAWACAAMWALASLVQQD